MVSKSKATRCSRMPFVLDRKAGSATASLNSRAPTPYGRGQAGHPVLCDVVLHGVLLALAGAAVGQLDARWRIRRRERHVDEHVADVALRPAAAELGMFGGRAQAVQLLRGVIAVPRRAQRRPRDRIGHQRREAEFLYRGDRRTAQAGQAEAAYMPGDLLHHRIAGGAVQHLDLGRAIRGGEAQAQAHGARLAQLEVGLGIAGLAAPALQAGQRLCVGGRGQCRHLGLDEVGSHEGRAGHEENAHLQPPWSFLMQGGFVAQRSGPPAGTRHPLR
jgi:hypothetical protein